ncbi:MAG: serine/threonine protein kinase [Planctomycetes bacterium]|nr:serine/threonine protein kinase [Planctomycetota bacterium]
MNAERWQAVSAELEHCLALAEGERAARLVELASSDPELAREVRTLLDEESRAERIRPAGAFAQTASAAVGARVGPWRLVERLARGGMGEVWVGERVEGGFEQRAAVKLVSRWSGDPELGVHFRRERALLATLEHPCIARLIDGGETPQGEPYLALELVDGVAIDRWCDERALDVRARVALFAEVADAVHFAHRRLVVHRDLKPANVLVTRDGRPKLLDFGIAKLLGDERADGATTAGFLTPRYASPEQVRGEPVTVESDVYSLGVVLFELLTGAQPYGEPSTTPLELARAVVDAPARKASAAVLADSSVALACGGHERAARALAGELDIVLAKALAKEPARRYPTAGDFADDLRRCLRGLPIAARPDTWTYRSRKLVARHKLASAALVGALVALLAGLGASLAATGRAVRAEARAEKRFEQVRELSRSLVFGVHDRVAKLAGSTDVRRYLVDTTRAYLDDLAADGELAPELADEIASTYLRLAEVHGGPARGGTGDVEGALASARRALELRTKHAAGLPDAELRLSDVHGVLGDLERSAGRVEAAHEHYAELERLARGLLARDAGSLAATRGLARAVAQRGRLAALRGDRAQSLALAREARELLRPFAAEREVARDFVLLSTRMGEDLCVLGEFVAAEQELQSAVAAAAAARAEDMHDAQRAVDHGSALAALARVHAARRDLAAARARLDAALDVLRPARAIDPTNLVVAEALSIALETLGTWQRESGELEAALASWREGLAALETVLATGSDDRDVRHGVAQLVVLAGLVEQALGRAGDARACFERALELTEADARGADTREATVEIRSTARVGLVDLELAAGERERAGAMLEALWTELAPLCERFPDVAWSIRKRGVVAWRLATWLEERSTRAERSVDDRKADLARARELYALGAEDGRRLAARDWLLESERDIVELFEADVRRCDELATKLDVSAGP